MASMMLSAQVNIASNWTMVYAESQGGDILNCWCEAQGYAPWMLTAGLQGRSGSRVPTCKPDVTTILRLTEAKLVQDSSLVSTCTPWFLETARGIGALPLNIRLGDAFQRVCLSPDTAASFVWVRVACIFWTTLLLF